VDGVVGKNTWKNGFRDKQSRIPRTGHEPASVMACARPTER
jgi:hypothetical protein